MYNGLSSNFAQPSNGYKQINKPMAFGCFITSDGTELN